MEWVTPSVLVQMTVIRLLFLFPFLFFSPPPLPFLLHVCQDANAQTDADTSVPRSATQRSGHFGFPQGLCLCSAFPMKVESCLSIGQPPRD